MHSKLELLKNCTWGWMACRLELLLLDDEDDLIVELELEDEDKEVLEVGLELKDKEMEEELELEDKEKLEVELELEDEDVLKLELLLVYIEEQLLLEDLLKELLEEILNDDEAELSHKHSDSSSSYKCLCHGPSQEKETSLTESSTLYVISALQSYSSVSE